MAALTFVRFSAPDLALTQLAVEVVTILLLLLALFFLPQQVHPNRSRCAAAGTCCWPWDFGGCTGLLTWGLLTRPYQTISAYFLANSVPKGGGANVVNVILVDFRGFDTLGEITVLALAAVGIYALLDGLCLAPGANAGIRPTPLGGRTASPDSSRITRFFLPLALLVSIHFFSART